MDLGPEDDDEEDMLCDVCEMPVADCVCEEFDDEEGDDEPDGILPPSKYD